MPTALVNGVELFYDVHGSGEPLVLLHGLGASSQDWEHQVPDFSRHYQVITPDLRGLTMRRAKQLAARHGFTPRFVGSGVVRKQHPTPGQTTGYQFVKLYCETGAAEGGTR